MAESNKNDKPAEPFKMGFSLKKNTTSKVATLAKELEAQEKRDFVVSISGNQIASLTPEEKKGPLVIPLPEAKAPKIHKKYLKLVHGLNTMDDKEENKMDEESKDQTENPSTESTTVSTGQPESIDDQAARELITEAQGEYVEVPQDMDLPLLLKHRDTNLDDIENEEQRFRADVASRPNEASSEGYENVPVEMFGTAMLRGMGWSEGAAIGVGKNAKVVPVVEFVTRPGWRTGLGATPLDIPADSKKKKRIPKPGESREPKEPQVLTDGKGNLKSVRRDGEELTPLSKIGLHEGSLVGIVQGPHDGLYARVVKIYSSTNELIVRLESSNEDVKVSKDDVTLVDEKRLKDSHPALLFMEEYEKRVQDKTESKKPKYDKDKSEGATDSAQKKKDITSTAKSSWMFPHLIVRIVSKSFENGKHYLKKGTIVDVIDSQRCTVQLQESKKLVEAKQAMLETVVPKVGERVMIVEGKHKGKIGVIMEKPKSGEGSKAIVQLARDLVVEQMELDSICHYVGEYIDR